MKAYRIGAVVCALFCSISAFGQDEPHLYTLTTWKSVIPEGGTRAERDSILSLYTEGVVKKNSKIISEKQFAHAYTNNSEEWFVLTEYKNWADIDAAGTMDDELMKKMFPDEKQRAAYGRMFSKYFPSHSDRIIAEVPKLTKK